MAPKKKFVKYELSTITHYGYEYRMMDAYTDLRQLLDMNDATLAGAGQTWNRFQYVRLHLDSGDYKSLNDLGEWHIKTLKTSAFFSSQEFDTLNEKVMAEYDSREDLQEIYKTCVAGCYWVTGRFGENFSIGSPGNEHLHERPAHYRMLCSVLQSNDAKVMREKNRDTGFQEGDLVLLRKPYVSANGIDPFYINPYSVRGLNGEKTPDSSVPRIGTVIAVTDKLTEKWHPAKGMRILKVLWMGTEDIVDVELRYLKWHERPTKKNGLVQ